MATKSDGAWWLELGTTRGKGGGRRKGEEGERSWQLGNSSMVNGETINELGREG